MINKVELNCSKTENAEPACHMKIQAGFFHSDLGNVRNIKWKYRNEKIFSLTPSPAAKPT
jgi:hypothetical protein